MIIQEFGNREYEERKAEKAEDFVHKIFDMLLAGKSVEASTMFETLRVDDFREIRDTIKNAFYVYHQMNIYGELTFGEVHDKKTLLSKMDGKSVGELTEEEMEVICSVCEYCDCCPLSATNGCYKFYGPHKSEYDELAKKRINIEEIKL